MMASLPVLQSCKPSLLLPLPLPLLLLLLLLLLRSCFGTDKAYVHAAAQAAMISATGDNTALATSIATYAPSNKTLTCLATSIITNSGQDAIAQRAAVFSYQTTVDQTIIAAGRNASKASP